MKEKINNFYLPLAFLPVLIFCLNPFIGFVSAILVMALGLIMIEDSHALKHAFKPLMLVIAVFSVFAAMGFLNLVFSSLSGVFPRLRFSGFMRFMTGFTSFVEFAALLFMLVAVVLILVSLKTKKESKIVNHTLSFLQTGVCACKTKKEDAESKDEIIIDVEEDEEEEK
ncbi:MAG: hypothetical protein ACOX6H_04390 [Christensenellales bacterium]|jgi:hypothetical protein